MVREQKMYVSFETTGKRYATLCDSHKEALDMKGFLLLSGARYVRINRSGRLTPETKILNQEKVRNLFPRARTRTR